MARRYRYCFRIGLILMVSHCYERIKDMPSMRPISVSSQSENLLYSLQERRLQGNANTGEASIKPFPPTKFTPHIEQDILQVMEKIGKPYNPKGRCQTYRIIVPRPYTAPSHIECDRKNFWCSFFQIVFRNTTRILPYNVTVGITASDFEKPTYATYGICLGSSSANGELTMTNFQDAMELVRPHNLQPNVHGWQFGPAIPWQQRKTIPVFRGDPRLRLPLNPKYCPNNVVHMGHRAKAAMFSIQNPYLLDAVLSPDPNAVYSCNKFSETNGMDQLFRRGKYSVNSTSFSPVHIPPNDYYTQYQTALVLGGVGAAFRTGRHLAAGQAVILQDFKYVEWYIKYMTPYVHYIPLKQDLSNLRQILLWVRDNPERVQEIAENGRLFYWQFLDFANTQDHWFELLWRLSLKLEQYGPTNLQRANEHSFWGNSSHFVFSRIQDGSFVPQASQ